MGHYTIKFDGCQIVNEIHHEDKKEPEKGTWYICCAEKIGPPTPDKTIKVRLFKV